MHFKTDTPQKRIPAQTHQKSLLVMRSEGKKTLKEMKNKVSGIDNLSSDVMMLGGDKSLKQITNIFIQILETKKIPFEWKEAKIRILLKKRDTKDIKNNRPISLLSHMCKLFTWVLPKQVEKVLDENQPREQAGFRQVTQQSINLQTVNQQIEKCSKFNRPLCIRFIDYEKAFDSIEREAVFMAFRTIGINETCITILEDIFTGTSARVHKYG